MSLFCFPETLKCHIQVKGEQNSLFPVRPVSVLLYLPIKNRKKNYLNSGDINQVHWISFQGAVNGIESAGVQIVSVTDVTPVPHNGCKPRKTRRL